MFLPSPTMLEINTGLLILLREINLRGRKFLLCSPLSLMIVKSKIEIIISPNQCTCTCTYVLLADDCSPTGYTRLLENDSSHRDNFYIRSKMSYQRPPVRGGSQLLSYEKGDIFHVFDTLPTDHLGMWNVKKLNSRGEAIETGLIPVEVRCIMMLILHVCV